MPREKRRIIHNKKKKKLMQAVKGYKWGRKNLVKVAKTARTKAGAHAYVDRRKKKRTMRGLWQIKIGAFVREHGLSYSRFIASLKENKIEVDRKVLADLAENNKEAMLAIIAKLKK